MINHTSFLRISKKMTTDSILKERHISIREDVLGTHRMVREVKLPRVEIAPTKRLLLKFLLIQKR